MDGWMDERISTPLVDDLHITVDVLMDLMHTVSGCTANFYP